MNSQNPDGLVQYVSLESVSLYIGPCEKVSFIKRTAIGKTLEFD